MAKALMTILSGIPAGMKRWQVVILVLSASFLSGTVSGADNCPTAQDVKYRLVPSDYEWSVAEGITLERLLSVERLVAVSLENEGEFIACKYAIADQFLRLDGLPKKEDCRVAIANGPWITTKTGRSFCDEEDATVCHFEVNCTSP